MTVIIIIVDGENGAWDGTTGVSFFMINNRSLKPTHSAEVLVLNLTKRRQTAHRRKTAQPKILLQSQVSWNFLKDN